MNNNMINNFRSLSLVACLPFIFSESFSQSTEEDELPPPNILWISWEDVSQTFGCYGDDYAVTPKIPMGTGSEY